MDDYPPRPFWFYWFDGYTYEPELDEERLKLQLWRVFRYMCDGQEHTLAELAEATGGSEASCSARLRDFRKERFGEWIVERRRIDRGLFGYTLKRPPDLPPIEPHLDPQPAPKTPPPDLLTAYARPSTVEGMTPDQRAVFNAAYRIGVALDRKFEASDMTVELRQAARLYAATYDGDFEYMVAMREQATSGSLFFSDNQSKSILNCLMADARRRMANRKPAADQVAVTRPVHTILETVPDGRYRVTLPDGDHLALRISKAGDDSKLKGSRIVSTRINGDEWMGVGDATPDGRFRQWRSCQGPLRNRVLAAVNVLDQAKTQDEWLVAGLAFAQEGSQCFICGRDLDTPESLTAGYGPVCADKHGLPWGAKAVPMSVRLAQASAPQIDPETGAQESAEELLDLAEATRPEPTPIRSHAQAKAEGRPRTYEEIFGEDAL